MEYNQAFDHKLDTRKAKKRANRSVDDGGGGGGGGATFAGRI